LALLAGYRLPPLVPLQVPQKFHHANPYPILTISLADMRWPLSIIHHQPNVLRSERLISNIWGLSSIENSMQPELAPPLGFIVCR